MREVAAAGDVETRFLFPTPIAQAHLSGHEDLNERLYETAVAWQRENGQAPKHVDAWEVLRGWEIGPDFFGVLAEAAPVRELRDAIERCFLDYVNRHHLALDFSPPRVADSCSIGASWATMIRDNALLADEHIHHGTHFVGVYYVKVPDEIDGRDNEAGYLVLRDPRPGMHVSRLGGQKTVELVRPEPGLLVLMPAYVSHAVRPFWEGGERLSVNCNINIGGLRLR